MILTKFTHSIAQNHVAIEDWINTFFLLYGEWKDFWQKSHSGCTNRKDIHHVVWMNWRFLLHNKLGQLFPFPFLTVLQFYTYNKLFLLFLCFCFVECVCVCDFVMFLRVFFVFAFNYLCFLCVYICACLLCLSVCLPFSVCLSTWLSAWFVCLSVCLPACLSVSLTASIISFSVSWCFFVSTSVSWSLFISFGHLWCLTMSTGLSVCLLLTLSRKRDLFGNMIWIHIPRCCALRRYLSIHTYLPILQYNLDMSVLFSLDSKSLLFISAFLNIWYVNRVQTHV